MHDICCVNLPWSAKARLRKLSLQLPHLSVFSLIKRIFRDTLKEMFPSGNVPTPEIMEKKETLLQKNVPLNTTSIYHLNLKFQSLKRHIRPLMIFSAKRKLLPKKEKRKLNYFRRTEMPLFAIVIFWQFCMPWSIIKHL